MVYWKGKRGPHSRESDNSTLVNLPDSGTGAGIVNHQVHWQVIVTTGGHTWWRDYNNL